jgi:hypothetical protein
MLPGKQKTIYVFERANYHSKKEEQIFFLEHTGELRIIILRRKGRTELPEHDQYLPMWHIDVVFESLIVFDSHPPA